jgi:tetratricopeptide (TPR) repeat protein
MTHGNPQTLNPNRKTLLAGGIIVLVVLVAYGHTFSVPFIYDDAESITTNPTLCHLWPVWRALTPPHAVPSDGGRPVAGRPIFNLSLAVNYALSGEAVWSYHALNLAIHVFAGLVLFGVVRRTLLQLRLRKHFGDAAWWLALAVAVLWTVHPLQTEAVTYISQRAESLMGLFYLLTLYCFIRGVERRSGFTPDMSGINPDLQIARGKGAGPSGSQPQLLVLGSQPSTLNSQLWLAASLLFCLLGMSTKEVMVSSPLIVLLYDRTFVAGTFQEAWSKRWRLYAGLASTWLWLGYLVANTQGRGGSAGFGTHVTWWSYALTQFRAIVHYLRLSLWPDPLVFDYGTTLATRTAEILPYAAVVLLLVAGTALALWRWPAVGFLGAWFFAILAPSSSVVPVATETMAEHRMYLALVAVVVPVVLGFYSLLGRRSAVIFLALVAGLGCVTVRRNQDYRGELAIWSDTVAKCPGNERAHNNLGNALLDVPGRLADAMAEFEAALRIKPDDAEAHNNLGSALIKVPGRLADAMAEFEAALRINPEYAEAHNNLGNALLNLPGRAADAMAEFETALRINPDYAIAHYDLGNAFCEVPGRLPDAVAQYEEALRINPASAETHANLGTALLNLPGCLPDAMAEFETALRINPDFVEAHNNLGNALSEMPGRLPDAIAQYQAALRIKPDYAEARNSLGSALAQQGHLDEALAQFEEAVRLVPEFAEAHCNLGNALAQSGRLPEAVEQYQLALQFKPDFAEARNNLEQARRMMAQPAAGSNR